MEQMDSHTSRRPSSASRGDFEMEQKDINAFRRPHSASREYDMKQMDKPASRRPHSFSIDDYDMGAMDMHASKRPLSASREYDMKPMDKPASRRPHSFSRGDFEMEQMDRHASIRPHSASREYDMKPVNKPASRRPHSVSRGDYEMQQMDRHTFRRPRSASRGDFETEQIDRHASRRLHSASREYDMKPMDKPASSRPHSVSRGDYEMEQMDRHTSRRPRSASRGDFEMEQMDRHASRRPHSASREYDMKPMDKPASRRPHSASREYDMKPMNKPASRWPHSVSRGDFEMEQMDRHTSRRPRSASRGDFETEQMDRHASRRLHSASREYDMKPMDKHAPSRPHSVSRGDYEMEQMDRHTSRRPRSASRGDFETEQMDRHASRRPHSASREHDMKPMDKPASRRPHSASREHDMKPMDKPASRRPHSVSREEYEKGDLNRWPSISSSEYKMGQKERRASKRPFSASREYEVGHMDRHASKRPFSASREYKMGHMDRLTSKRPLSALRGDYESGQSNKYVSCRDFSYEREQTDRHSSRQSGSTHRAYAKMQMDKTQLRRLHSATKGSATVQQNASGSSSTSRSTAGYRGNRQWNHWDFLKQLSTYDINEKVIYCITNLNYFVEFLRKVSFKNADLTTDILNTFVQILKSRLYPNLQLQFIIEIKELTFLERLITKIKTEPELAIEKVQLLLDCLNLIFEKVPSDIVFMLGINQLLEEIRTLIDNGQFPEEDKHEVKLKFKTIDKFVDKQRERQTDVKTTLFSEISFRSLPVIPTLEDLHTYNSKVPVNKIYGKYEKSEVYLDTWFKLVKEDLVRPMREAIKSYNQGRKQKHTIRKKLEVYRNVKIVTSVPRDGINHLVSFDTSVCRHIHWSLGKRLKFGSLVFISPDEFQSGYFATVTESTQRELSKGNVIVRFEQGLNKDHMEQTFLMVESPVYFEPYRHILSALKKFPPDNEVPFAKYIVDLEQTIQPPAYIISDDSLTLYDSMDESSSLTSYNSVDESSVVFRRPTGAEFDLNVFLEKRGETLNDSQLNAVKFAQDHEVTIIQGPPGCGKTYIGLIITEMLLAYHRKILVVCYTNHALDQFLEGIANFHTEGLVRVGGRSKSEKLKEFNLKEICRNRNFYMPKTEKIQKRKLKYKLDLLAEQRKIILDNIVNESALKKAMGRSIYSQFRDDRKSGKSPIGVWLGIYKMLETASTKHKQSTLVEEEYFESDDEQIENEDVSKYQDEETGVKEERKSCFMKKIESFRRSYLAIDFDNTNVVSSKIFDDTTKRKIIQTCKQEIRAKRCKGLPHSFLDVTFDNILTDPPEEIRWNLYNSWVYSLSEELNGKAADIEIEYEPICKRLEELSLHTNYEILKRASVIGVTTSSAARLQQLLQEVKPNAIIIEEAAEILEAHVIPLLHTDIQHVILIGDHKQLRPKANVYDLEKNNNFGISMFERLVRNKIEYRTLDVQHRMKPEIADILRFIYPNLRDSETVQNREKIKGIVKDVFFLSHKKAEVVDFDGTGFSNEHEVDFLAELCRYILAQTYTASQITILTAYSSQLYKLKKRFKTDPDITDIAIKVIDDFQGEENDIILLSFVRSNKEGRSGFLKEDNRVCVALSRAKIGLFAIGDFEMYAHNSDLWSKVVKYLKSENKIGPYLFLQCQNHPNDEPLKVATAQDFINTPNGGCKRPCDYRLECGHVCKWKCHSNDREHKTFRCIERCYRECPNHHPCQTLCSNQCVCSEKVTVSLPCGHNAMVSCGKEKEQIKCEETCRKKLDCGHECLKLCNEPCHPCNSRVKVLIPNCGHYIETFCFQQSMPNKKQKCGTILECNHYCTGDGQNCKEKCVKDLPCGHCCPGICGECTKNGIHENCSEQHTFKLFCGHECSDRCGSFQICTKQCGVSCAHFPCNAQCNQQCRECNGTCPWKCPHFQCTKLCGEICNRQRCNELCDKTFDCGHSCPGLCGDPCPKSCWRCNSVPFAIKRTNDRQRINVFQVEGCQHFIEYDLMDEYMESENTGILKRCLVCAKYILKRVGNRYEKELNETFQEINKTKVNFERFLALSTYLTDTGKETIRTFLHNIPIEFAKDLNDMIESKGVEQQMHSVTDFINCLNNCTKAMVSSKINSENVKSSDTEFETCARCQQRHKIIWKEIKIIIVNENDFQSAISRVNNFIASLKDTSHEHVQWDPSSNKRADDDLATENAPRCNQIVVDAPFLQLCAQTFQEIDQSDVFKKFREITTIIKTDEMSWTDYKLSTHCADRDSVPKVASLFRKPENIQQDQASPSKMRKVVIQSNHTKLVKEKSPQPSTSSHLLPSTDSIVNNPPSLTTTDLRHSLIYDKTKTENLTCLRRKREGSPLTHNVSLATRKIVFHSDITHNHYNYDQQDQLSPSKKPKVFIQSYHTKLVKEKSPVPSTSSHLLPSTVSIVKNPPSLTTTDLRHRLNEIRQSKS